MFLFKQFILIVLRKIRIKIINFFETESALLVLSFNANTTDQMFILVLLSFHNAFKQNPNVLGNMPNLKCNVKKTYRLHFAGIYWNSFYSLITSVFGLYFYLYYLTITVILIGGSVINLTSTSIFLLTYKLS